MTLTDSATRKRRDYWLGPYGSGESRERYHRVIAAWEASGRRLPERDFDVGSGEGGLTLTMLIRDYWVWARSEYCDATCFHIRQALRATKKLFGTTAAVDFGPNRLRLVREEMLKPSAPTGKVLARQTINRRVGWIIAMGRSTASFTQGSLHSFTSPEHRPESTSPVLNSLGPGFRSRRT